jgi:hypothetical protein
VSLASIQRTATKLCGKFGRTVTFNRYKPLRLPSGGVELGAPTATFSVSAVVLPAGASDNRLIIDTLAGKQSCYLQVAAQYATFVPKALDEVVIPSLGAADSFAGTWQVQVCEPISPNGLDITYGVGAVKL